MKTLLCLIPMPALAATLFLSGNQIERYETRSEFPDSPGAVRIDFDSTSEAGQVIQQRLDEDWNGHTVDGTNVYYQGVLVEFPPIPPRIPPAELLQTAAVFRQILRLHFGAGAETNHAVTAQSVTAHLVTRRLTLPSSERLDDSSDGMLLTSGFESITAWTGDGTIWTFPFHLIPEPETP